MGKILSNPDTDRLRRLAPPRVLDYWNTRGGTAVSEARLLSRCPSLHSVPRDQAWDGFRRRLSVVICPCHTLSYSAHNIDRPSSYRLDGLYCRQRARWPLRIWRVCAVSPRDMAGGNHCCGRARARGPRAASRWGEIATALRLIRLCIKHSCRSLHILVPVNDGEVRNN